MDLTIFVAASPQHKYAVQLIQTMLKECTSAQILDWTDKEVQPPAGLVPVQQDAWYCSEQACQAFKFCVDACVNADLVIYYGKSGLDTGLEIGLAAASGVPILGIKGSNEVPDLMLHGVVGVWVQDIPEAVNAVQTLTRCDSFPLSCIDCRVANICPHLRSSEEEKPLFGRVCRVCGCDNFHACPGGCYWVEDDLCSACAEKEKHYDQS